MGVGERNVERLKSAMQGLKGLGPGLGLAAQIQSDTLDREQRFNESEAQKNQAFADRFADLGKTIAGSLQQKEQNKLLQEEAALQRGHEAETTDKEIAGRRAVAALGDTQSKERVQLMQAELEQALEIAKMNNQTGLMERIISSLTQLQGMQGLGGGAGGLSLIHISEPTRPY